MNLRTRPTTGFALTISAILFLQSGLALAHARLLRSEPAPGSTVSTPPARVVLKFSESVEPVVSKIEVKALKTGAVVSESKPHTAGSDKTSLQVALKSPLPPGKYNVTWRTVSVDTHHVHGAFSFTVAPR